MKFIDAHTHYLLPRDILEPLISKKKEIHPFCNEILEHSPNWGYRVEQKIFELDDFCQEWNIKKMVLLPFDFLGVTNTILLNITKKDGSFYPHGLRGH